MTDHAEISRHATWTIARVRPLLERFTEKYVRIPESGCWIWIAGTDPKGYGFLYSHQHGKHRAAHRISLELHGVTVPDGSFVCHRCDVPSCVNPDHLFVGSPTDNVRDMIAKGRARLVKNGKGEACPRAVLSVSDVAIIKARLAAGHTLKNIGNDYGLHLSTIHHIKTGKSWADVPAAETLELAIARAAIAVGKGGV